MHCSSNLTTVIQCEQSYRRQSFRSLKATSLIPPVLIISFLIWKEFVKVNNFATRSTGFRSEFSRFIHVWLTCDGRCLLITAQFDVSILLLQFPFSPFSPPLPSSRFASILSLLFPTPTKPSRIFYLPRPPTLSVSPSFFLCSHPGV